jgi:hypothetical protein
MSVLSSQGIQVAHIYEDSDGISHIRDFEIPFSQALNIGLLSPSFAADRLQFRYTPGDYECSWHCAPQRQFILNLLGSVELELGDGTRRIVPQGGVMFLEDVNGKGHISKSVDGNPRYSVFIHVPDHVQFPV